MMGLLRQSIRFAVVGLVNTTIGLAAIYAVMFFFQSGPAIANAIGYAIGLAVSFALNRIWTFNSSRSISDVLPRYLTVAAISYFLNLGVVILATSIYSINPYLGQLFGVVIYTIFMFFGCRIFVFPINQTV
jgi:putative flippase GtrA